MKVERFLKEYANYMLNKLNNNELMNIELKEKAINKVQRAIVFREKGMITANETIKAILNCFED